jgi:hypothetical protein
LSEYLRIALETAPEDLLAQMRDDLQTRIPGWDGKAGNLDQAVLEVNSFALATLLDVAGSVQDTIFRELLASLFGIVPGDATFAVVDSTWTMKDTLGYTIPIDTEIKVATSGNTAVGFAVTQTVVVPPGSSTTAVGEVPLRALIEGADGTGLSGIADIVTPLEGPTVVTLEGVSVGGRDAEEDSVFLDEGRDQLRDLSFGLELVDDVERAIRRIDGVDRVLVIDNYYPGVNELQTVTVTGASSGTFTLTYSGQTTTTIAYNAVASVVQAALEGLSNIDLGDVAVTGGPLNTAPVTIEFKGTLAHTNVAAMTFGTAISSGSAAIATTRTGIASDPNTAGSLSYAAIDSAGLPVPSGVGDEILAMLVSRTQQGFAFNPLVPTYTTIPATFVATAYLTFDATAVLAAAITALTDYLSPANWGRLPYGDQRVWMQDTLVRYSEAYAVLNAVAGLQHVTALTLNSLTNTDVALAGTAALPLPGVVSGVVT